MEKEKEKLCEYLSEIGILLFDNINTFLNIYSENNSKKFNSKQENQKYALFIYLQETLKNEQYLKSISNNIIETYYNKQAINRYNALTNLVNIFNLKLFSNYNFFISRIISYIIKNKENKSEINNDKNNYNDKQNEIKKSNKKKKSTKKVNKYKNNWYKNIYDDGVVQHGFFLRNNNINNFIDSSDNINYNYNYNNRYQDYDLENINNFKSSELPLNYYIPIYNNIRDHSDFNINKNIDISPEESLIDNYDFFESQEKHEQKVKNKLFLLETEREEKLKRQCTFKPKINSKREYDIIPKQIIDNKFEKLYNDSIINKIKLNEKIKKNFDDIKFKPNLKETENYIVASTFQERLIKSINMKQKRKKDLNEINNKNKNQIKKEGHYGLNLEKKKKILENITNKINNNNINNIIIKESSNEIGNNDIDKNKNKNNEEEKKDENKKENINDKYKSSIKHLLNNNSLLKNEY